MRLAVLVFALLLACSRGFATAQERVEESVLGYLTRTPRFATTVRLFYVTGYVNTVRGNFTVFAPTEKAWDGGNFRSLLGYQSPNSNAAPDATAATEVLRGFAARGNFPPERVGKGQKLKNLSGQPLTVAAAAKSVAWTGRGGAGKSAPVVGEPVICEDGVVYPMDVVVGQ